MVQKLLYAVQAKPIEDALTGLLQQETNGKIISVGTAGYREQVVQLLEQSNADLLLYREGLKGSQDIFGLMSEIREKFPHVRIIFIANHREISNHFLCSLVCLGIYDIINEDKIPIRILLDYILHPHNFGDVSKYFHPQYMEALLPKEPETIEQTAESSEANKNLLAGFSKFISNIGKLFSGSVNKPEAPIPIALTAPPVTPDIDLEAMRSAMLEAARRDAQAEVGELVKTQVEVETLSIKESLAQANEMITRLSQEVQTHQESETKLKGKLEEALILKQNTENQFAQFREQTDIAIQQYKAQLLQLQTTKSPDWYKEQTDKWLKERGQYQAEIAGLKKNLTDVTGRLETAQEKNIRLETDLAEQGRKIESLSLAVPRDISTAVSATLEDDYVLIPDDEAVYHAPVSGTGEVIAFLGAKHGVGNTTVAINTAIALANAGFKTCFVELNQHFPLSNVFFGFDNISLGLDSAILALQQNNAGAASRCIIKPHGISTQSKNMKKIYDHLPGPLHFLLYSNRLIQKCRMGGAFQLTNEAIKELTYFLLVREHYSYVILDLQPDNTNDINICLMGGYQANRLFITTTQDPHSVQVTKTLITMLARSSALDLLRNSEFILNRYTSRNKMTLDAFVSNLRIPKQRITKISLDSEGYMNSNYSMVPYILSKGPNVGEYMDLRMKITRSGTH